MENYTVRPALESESTQIKDLINLVGINPTGLDWKRFIVAVNDGGQVIGCGQIKPHGGRHPRAGFHCGAARISRTGDRARGDRNVAA